MTKRIGTVAVALWLAACGGDDSGSEGSGGVAAGATAGSGASAGSGGLAGGGSGGGGGAGASGGAGAVATEPLSLSSDVVAAGAMIPAAYRCDGPSPPLSWSGGPEGATSFAIVLKDVTPGFSENFPHWALYDVPGDVRALPEGIPAGATIDAPVSGKQAPSWNGTEGYTGPCALSGTNTYRFTLYALDVVSLPAASPAFADVEAAAIEHALESATLEVTSAP